MSPRTSGAIVPAIRAQLCTALDRWLTLGVGPVDGFAELRLLIDSLPLTSAEFSTAVNRLDNIRRYLDAGEFGAALFELRLLRRSVQR